MSCHLVKLLILVLGVFIFVKILYYNNYQLRNIIIILGYFLRWLNAILMNNILLSKIEMLPFNIFNHLIRNPKDYESMNELEIFHLLCMEK